MSKLINEMIKELLINKGENIDNVIFDNISTIRSFPPKITQANCLTSSFLLDVDKNPKDGFLKICDEQENYQDKGKKEVILKDAIDLFNDFNDKDFKKNHKQSSLLNKFIDAILSNKNQFASKFNNELFLSSY